MGQYVGMETLIRVASDDYMSYAKAYYGASILIHGPEDFPQGSDKITTGQPGTDVTIGVTPSVVVSEDIVRSLPLRKRQCYFDNEVIKYCFKKK